MLLLQYSSLSLTQALSNELYRLYFLDRPTGIYPTGPCGQKLTLKALAHNFSQRTLAYYEIIFGITRWIYPNPIIQNNKIYFNNRIKS